ncbi:hypothetical protein PkP19E3_08875 [Pseudomonas koreensis]|nr:hypothetical protein PkP19E3_08875 [Pseudomonas koreensis]
MAVVVFKDQKIAASGSFCTNHLQELLEAAIFCFLLSKHFRKAKKSHRRGWLKGKTDKERKPVRVTACGDCAGSPDQWS